MDKPEFVINSKTGEKLLNWCKGKPVTSEDLLDKINNALSLAELTALYRSNPSFQMSMGEHFKAKKVQLENLSNPKNFSSNGNGH